MENGKCSAYRYTIQGEFDFAGDDVDQGTNTDKEEFINLAFGRHQNWTAVVGNINSLCSILVCRTRE